MTNINVVVHVVDDEEAVRSSLAFLLSAAGIAVRTHATAAAFLEIAPSIRSGCLVTDLQMPEIDGVELLRRLKDSGTMLPAIVITGHANVPMAVEAMKNGALDFIEKPFSDEALLQSIRHVVSLAAANARNEETVASTRKRLATLSERERQVLSGVVAGQANKTIAFELGISPRTVEVHRLGLMGKMQARGLAELIRMVMDAGGPTATSS